MKEKIRSFIVISRELPLTIGVGFNLLEQEVRKVVLGHFGYDTNSLSKVDFDSLNTDLLDIFKDPWSSEKIAQVNQILETYAAKITDGSSPRTTFEFQDTADMKPVFETIIASTTAIPAEYTPQDV